MKNKNQIDRSKILALAHVLQNEGMSFAEAQRQAWKVYKAKSQMLVGIVEITFQKKDGTTTTRLATVNPAFVPPIPKELQRQLSPLKVNFWSVRDNGYRSFLAQNFVGVKTVHSIRQLVSRQLLAA